MRFGSTLSIGLALAAIVAPARADIMTYTESVVASGTIGGVDFADARLTITATADPAGAATGDSPTEFVSTLSATSATLAIDGLGAATFTDPIVLRVDGFPGSPETSQVGVFDGYAYQGLEILGTEGAAFARYDFSTPLGPIDGPSSSDGITYHATFGTSMGDLAFTNIAAAGTFAAAGVAVPVPPTFALAGASAASLEIIRFARNLGVPGRKRRK